jgi:hypothetical protein
MEARAAKLLKIYVIPRVSILSKTGAKLTYSRSAKNVENNSQRTNTKVFAATAVINPENDDMFGITFRLRYPHAAAAFNR